MDNNCSCNDDFLTQEQLQACLAKIEFDNIDMKFYSVITENWKADGGACFGVVPKTIWQKSFAADENNMIHIVNRCLLIKANDRLILINTGMGNKQSEKYFSYFYLFGDDSMEKSFEKAGFKYDDVTDVIFTHLHFDHCGGAIFFNNNTNQYDFTFKNAKFYCSKKQWENALNPNSREKASYFIENYSLINESDKLILIDEEKMLLPGLYMKIFDGHTPGQIIPIINFNGKTLVYTSDFIPSTAHIPIPYVASYDIEPLKSLTEKELFLNIAVDNNYYLYFEHDSATECCNLVRTEKGIKLNQKFKLSDLFN